jgi:uncharacterized glyoxalase superfamily protein PhnB
MHKVFATFEGEGIIVVKAYLFVDHPKELIDFFENAFYAQRIDCSADPVSGEIANGIIRIGKFF